MKTIDEAVNYAAGKLPEGCQVVISIENGGYGVELHVDDQIISLDQNSIIDGIIVATDEAEDYLMPSENDDE